MSAMYSQEALDAAAKKLASLTHPDREEVDPIDIEAASKILSEAALADQKIDAGFDATIKDHTERVRRAVRGDPIGWYEDEDAEPDGGYVPDLDPRAAAALGFRSVNRIIHRDHTNMVAPMPLEYEAAHEFMVKLFGEDGYTPDAVGQLVEVFIPCLRIMVERGYEPNGALWRKSGLFGVMEDVQKKFDRYWFRTWTLGTRHDDSGFDLVNFVGMSLRIDPDSRWGERGEPAAPNGGQ